MAVNAARKYGVNPRSWIYPENRIGNVSVLSENGLQIYRGKSQRERNINRMIATGKITRIINNLIPAPVTPIYRDGIWELPKSMYFFIPHFFFSLLPRAKLGLYLTIWSNKIFHVWLHPWNLMMYKGLEEDLDKFLSLVNKMRNESKVELITMGELASRLRREVTCANEKT
jgi:hypothetical protein